MNNDFLLFKVLSYKGRMVRQHVGEFKGALSFLEEFIGYDINPITGEKIAAHWGKIHYAKDGVHIVPTKPR